MEAKSPRVAFVDIARAAAIVAVIVCHAADLSLKGFIYETSGLPLLCTNVTYTVGRLGVPLFLLISGYLLLGRTYDDAACRRFWKSKWLWLLAVTMAWTLIYALYLWALTGQPLNVASTLKEFLLLRSPVMPHFWYMPMILGLYLFLPVMANALSRIAPRTLAFPLLVCTVLFSVLPTVEVFTTACLGIGCSTTIAEGFSGGIYGLYMVLGLAVRNGLFSKVPTPAVAVAAGASFALATGMQFLLCSQGHAYVPWYPNVFLLVCGTGLFELLSRTKAGVAPVAVEKISKYSFAMYLTHYMVMYAVAWPLALLLPDPFVCAAALFVLGLAGSLLASAGLARVPGASFLLYMKPHKKAPAAASK